MTKTKENEALLSEVKRKMALSYWYLRLTLEEAEALRQWVLTHESQAQGRPTK